ncbi:Druantia anti-phage system protein DruA [Puia sp. P3]|uniref:Druantia anti-phage system protein DruA n=1 Tax=Puia sp. P3 TaxID=3423952 RepID=UPI003D666656
MQREIININPKLSETHRVEFLGFCKRIKRKIQTREYEDRVLILSAEKASVNKLYRGKAFHSNTDLVFMENLILDLLFQDWNLVIQRGQIQLELEVLDAKDKNMDNEKLKTRRRHLLARDAQLGISSVKDFIRGMEKRRLTTTGWHSIFSVMRDGVDLSRKLRLVSNFTNDQDREEYLQTIVRPVIQIVEPGERCHETGLFLSDIWRYFRHTWVSEYKSLPGRTISILIRDSAVQNSPVIGIAALGSSVAQQTCRDKWIGWDGDAFMERMLKEPTNKYAKWIVTSLNDLLNEIYLKDFYREK